MRHHVAFWLQSRDKHLGSGARFCGTHRLPLCSPCLEVPPTQTVHAMLRWVRN